MVRRTIQRVLTGKTPRSALEKAKNNLNTALNAEVKNVIVNTLQTNNPAAQARTSTFINLPKHQSRFDKLKKLTGLQEVISRIHEAKKKEKKIIYFDWHGYPNSSVVEPTPRKNKPIISAPIKGKDTKGTD